MNNDNNNNKKRKIYPHFIILTEGSDSSKKIKVAIHPEDITSIEARQEYSGCKAQVYLDGRESQLDTTESFNEIMQLIDEYYNKHYNKPLSDEE